MNQVLGSRFVSVVTSRSARNELQVIGLGREDGLPYLTYQDDKGDWHDVGRLMENNDTPWSTLVAARSARSHVKRGE
jgi:hypothetical protein